MYSKAIITFNFRFISFSNSITNQSEQSIWLKVEYILEFAQWLFSNEYSLANCTDLVEWAVDLLMFRVRCERLVRVSSASTTVSKSGKVSKLKPRAKPHASSNPLIIVPETLNEDDADKVIVQNLSTEMSTVLEASQG